MKVLFKLLIIVSLFIGTVQAKQSGLQKGDLLLHNTLAEPVDYQYQTVINGIDPDSGVRIANSTVSNKGTVQPGEIHQVSSSPSMNLGTGDIWGAIIYIILKIRQQEQFQEAISIEQLGTYAVVLDQQGILTLSEE